MYDKPYTFRMESPSFEEHLPHVASILELIQLTNRKAPTSRCRWCYAGEEGGLKSDTVKVAATVVYKPRQSRLKI